MKYRQLIRDGTQVSVLGLGTWPLGGHMGQMDERTATSITRAAIDSGINLIDTAQAYHPSETRLGRALKDGYRERCFLASKAIGDYSPAGIRAAMEDSLRNLEVDFVDLYQVHHPDPAYPFDQTMHALERLQEQGKTRYFGVSNYDLEHMQASFAAAHFHTNQTRYNMLDRRREAGVLPFCQQHEIGVLAHSPLAKGLLTGRYRVGHSFPDDDERAHLPRFRGATFAHYVGVADQLQELAADKGISLVQMAIGWLLRLPAVSCVLVGAKSPKQVSEHLAAADVTFTADELERIEAILENTSGELYDS